MYLFKLEKKFIKLNLFLFLFVCIIQTSNSFSQDRNYITLSSAVFDLLQQDNLSFENRVEFRLGNVDLFAKPFSGLMVNSEGALYFYAGFYYDIALNDFLYLTPSFSPGIYTKNKSKDLRYILEFKSQVEISILFNHGARIGLSFNHISNASLGKKNPGVESLAITYIFPL